ncbi:diguanylate cyclase, partial [Escherichia coli]
LSLLLLDLDDFKAYNDTFGHPAGDALIRSFGEHDALSGLANRRSHDLALRQRIAQARRDRQPLSLLLLDLDDFKAYNDTFGHPAGDALIRSFGE